MSGGKEVRKEADSLQPTADPFGKLRASSLRIGERKDNAEARRTQRIAERRGGVEADPSATVRTG